jgi:hypothetical protein
MRVLHGLLCTAILISAGGALAAQQNMAYLKAKVNPGRAGVFVDGKYLGPAANFKVARTYALPPGQHDLKLIDPRFEDVDMMVSLTAGKTTVISQVMKPLPTLQGPYGELRTECPDKFAAVYINDKFYGHSGEFDHGTQALLLPPGTYSVRIEPLSGAAAVSKTVQVEADKMVVVKL